ncbi:MAG: RnfABCDGE type electron transport complex subunit B [Oscillospiraceae bacterium]
MDIILAVAIVTGIGLLGAVVLVVAGHFLHIEEDTRVSEVLSALPGANCGACGHAGCEAYAKAIVENGEKVNKCVPGGKKTAEQVAEIMGVTAGEVAEQKAVVACQGSYEHTRDKFDYEGIETCAACNKLYSGRSACRFGCLGYGDCVKECKFDAIYVENGVAKVDNDKCTGCGECAKACPNDIILILPESDKPVVLCVNKERGALTRKDCDAGCIGCMKCEKVCEFDAIKVHDNVASIDLTKCTGCQKCVEICPVKAIGVPYRD